MKNIIVVALIAVAVGVYYYMNQAGSGKPSELEQSLYGQWNGEYDAASMYFCRDHKMYVEGLSIVMEGDRCRKLI